MLYNRTFQGYGHKEFFASAARQGFVIPGGVTSITVLLVGAGGAGGIGYNGGSGGGGGSGGALRVRATVVPGDLYYIYVSPGGSTVGAVSTNPLSNTYIYPAATPIETAVAEFGNNGTSTIGGNGLGGQRGTYVATSFWTILASQFGQNGSNGSGVGGDGAPFNTFRGIAGTYGPGDVSGFESLLDMSATGYGAGGGGSYDRPTGVPATAEAGSGAPGYLRIEW